MLLGYLDYMDYIPDAAWAFALVMVICMFLNECALNYCFHNLGWYKTTHKAESGVSGVVFWDKMGRAAAK